MATEDEIRKITEEYTKSLNSLRTANEKTLKQTNIELKDRISIARERFRDRRQEIRDTYTEGQTRKRLIRILEQEEKEFDRKLRREEEYRDKIKSVSSALGGLYTAVERGEGTISSFTGVFKGRGVLGDAFSGLGSRLDTNIETFRQLSETGANFGKSIVDLRRAAGEALLPLDDFAQLVRGNAQNLAALFGSTTVGARRIADLSRGFRDLGVEQLAPLGFTVEEINETLLLNLERQRRTFNFDQNARQQNLQSALNFAKQLDLLAKLTGVQRSELQSQIEQQQTNERFQAFLAGQSREVGQRLEGFAGTIGAISPDLAEGFQDLIANAGVPVTEAGLQLVQNLPQAGKVVRQLTAGVISTEQALSMVRNQSIASQERFRNATVTGTVEFLRLQNGVIKLATTNLDLNAVLAEQGETSTALTQGLTTFQDATKRLSGQFQMIETGLLAAFGPALGLFADATQGLMKGVGGLVAGLAKVPALTGTAIAGILAGKYLFDKGAQTAMIFAGTFAALKAAGLGKGGMLGNLFGTKTGGRVAGAAKFGASRVIPGIGAALGVGSSLSMMASDDKDVRKAGKYGLGGAAAGAAAGAALGAGFFGIGAIPGALIGAGLGSMLGQGAGALLGGKKQFGGGMDAGKTYLVGEKGPEMVTAGTNSVVTANSDLMKTFNTKDLENKMITMVTELNNANKTLSNMVNGVNTLVAIESRSMKAVEKTARKDTTTIGNV